MKATLEFDLPEDQEEFNVCSRGKEFALAALEMDNQLRNWLKYGHTFTDADDALDTARQKLHEILEQYGLSTDMLS